MSHLNSRSPLFIWISQTHQSRKLTNSMSHPNARTQWVIWISRTQLFIWISRTQGDI